MRSNGSKSAITATKPIAIAAPTGMSRRRKRTRPEWRRALA
jgi:hypothetical protein